MCLASHGWQVGKRSGGGANKCIGLLLFLASLHTLSDDEINDILIPVDLIVVLQKRHWLIVPVLVVVPCTARDLKLWSPKYQLPTTTTTTTFNLRFKH